MKLECSLFSRPVVERPQQRRDKILPLFGESPNSIFENRHFAFAIFTQDFLFEFFLCPVLISSKSFWQSDCFNSSFYDNRNWKKIEK